MVGCESNGTYRMSAARTPRRSARRWSMHFAEGVMMSTQDVLKEIAWSSSCSLLESHAAHMAGLCHPAAAEMILSVARKFLQPPAPATDQELSLRRSQYHAVTSIICSVTHASSMARRRSQAVADEILRVVRLLCEDSL